MSYYLKKHWKINLLAAALTVALSGLAVCLNLFLINITEAIISRDMHTFIFWMLVNQGTWGVLILLEGALAWAKSKAICTMNNHLRADMAATLLGKSHREYHAQQSGEYISWFTNDVNQIENQAWNSFFSVISTAARVLFSLIVLARLHWSLFAVSLLAAVVIINAPKLFGKKVEQLSADVADQQAQGTSKLKDLLAGLDVLRFFDRVDRFNAGSRKASNQIEAPKHRLNYVQAFVGGGVDAINLTCQMAVNLLVGILSISGVIVQAALMGCGNLCGNIYNGLASLGRLRLAIIASKPYFEKITVHADENSVQVKESVEPVREAIDLEHVGFSYGDKPILRDMNLRFEMGKKYALTGPSGCGKSTLLKLLLGWLPDYSGSIRFDGKDARDFTAEQLQQQMSYIEQDVFLFNTTIRENITLGEEFSEAQMAKALRDSALDGDLANMPLGLNTPVGEAGSCLSGGQMQRVAIARALIHDRSILLVDEGTSALDRKNADIVEKSLLNNPDLTLILVSHHLSPEAKVQFDRVFALEPVQ